MRESSLMQLRELTVGCLGGGTGLPSLLGGLKNNPWLHINAVVTMFDSGGSSGQLRDELGVLPPGDVLKCALALARNEGEARRLLLSRLPSFENGRLGGHTGGNLLLSMMEQYSGDFLAAVDSLQALLDCSGQVWPVSVDHASVCAEYEDGSSTRGEVAVDAEQAQGRPLDGRSDVYALALCMVEGVTGHLPFVADTIADTLAARVGRDVPIPDALGPLVPVVASAGTAEVENRPTAREMGRLLLDVAGRMSRPEPLPLVGPGEVGAAPMPGEAEHGAPSVFVDPGPDTRAHSPVGSYSPVQPHAPVSGPQPRRRRWRAVLVATALLVVAVVGGWLLLSAGRTTTRAIPALVDTSGSSARSLLVELGWLVEERYDRRDGSLEGQVLSMQPPGGTRLEAGETVVLVVSLGPARLPVPDDLVGVSVEEAGRRLEAAGLALGTVSSEKDEAVAVGLVLSVITVDETLPQGSEVDLVVSGGPLPRVVPEGLVGLMPADVVAELIALRLAPTMGEEHDEWIAAGRVSRVEPVGGTRIQVNDDVRVVVLSLIHI